VCLCSLWLLSSRASLRPLSSSSCCPSSLEGCHHSSTRLYWLTLLASCSLVSPSTSSSPSSSSSSPISSSSSHGVVVFHRWCSFETSTPCLPCLAPSSNTSQLIQVQHSCSPTTLLSHS